LCKRVTYKAENVVTSRENNSFTKMTLIRRGRSLPGINRKGGLLSDKIKNTARTKPYNST
jgi:hypothetical protein